MIEPALALAIFIFGYAAVNVISALPLLFLFCVKKSVIRSLRYKFPSGSFVCFLGWIAALIIDGVLLAIYKDESGEDDDDDDDLLAGIFAVAYFINVVINCSLPSFRSIFHRFDASRLDQHVQALRATNIDLHFNIRASHTETRTYRDSDGNRKTETKEVVTYTGTRYAPVPFWIDLTGPIVIPPGSPFLRVDTVPVIEWCHGSEDIIERMRHHIWKKNRHRDENVTVETVTCIPGLIPHLVLKSPMMEATACQSCQINPLFCLMLNILGFTLHCALMLARNLPVVTHEVHKKASLVAPVVDDSWLRQYHVSNCVNTPRAYAFSTPDNVENWNWETSTMAEMPTTQPMFDNPMPLYVSYDTAMQYETPSAPPLPYMYMEGYDTSYPAGGSMQQAGYDPNAGRSYEAPSAPSAEPVYADAQPAYPPAQPAYADPNMAAAQQGYPPQQGYADPNAAIAPQGMVPDMGTSSTADPSAPLLPGAGDPNL